MTPTSKAAQAMMDELIEDLQEAREILENMVRSIELDGNYSTEATCTFLRQALNCLPRAATAAHSQAQVAEAVADEPLLQSYFEYVRDAYRNGNRQMYTLYEWQKHPSAPPASPVASEREGLTDEQILDHFEERAMQLRDSRGTPNLDGVRVIEGVRALLVTRTGGRNAD